MIACDKKSDLIKHPSTSPDDKKQQLYNLHLFDRHYSLWSESIGSIAANPLYFVTVAGGPHDPRCSRCINIRTIPFFLVVNVFQFAPNFVSHFSYFISRSIFQNRAKVIMLIPLPIWILEKLDVSSARCCFALFVISIYTIYVKLLESRKSWCC